MMGSFCAFMKLCIHIDINTRFQFGGYVVIPDSDLLDPASYQRFVKFGEVGSLLRNIILQVIDPLYLFIPFISSSLIYFIWQVDLSFKWVLQAHATYL